MLISRDLSSACTEGLSSTLAISCGVCESVGHAVPDGSRNFDDLCAGPRRARILMAPDLAAHCCDGVAEGEVRFAVPCGGSRREGASGLHVMDPQGREREEAEQRRGGAQDARSDHWRWVSMP